MDSSCRHDTFRAKTACGYIQTHASSQIKAMILTIAVNACTVVSEALEISRSGHKENIISKYFQAKPFPGSKLPQSWYWQPMARTAWYRADQLLSDSI